ncbi:MAG: NUDIX hydrolase [uncultured bacterium]|nr:MAG: NUDIX hydrolase [uncultured bacterium]OGJ47857.1 MAG: diadenosine tetraphosphate hydrolase [Candidatus Peregrinibacteria bacterium RIFOXYA2_FULL_41_18]OGJ48919.1 MAG: diadenosine tetraphosphate hydrolase [Candidatus Peregrinibacteria bacterium RIFOXYB12_FULL_41_12]
MENSAGIIIYKEEAGERLYLLLHYPQGHWDFPKGHIEAGESELDAAIRETREETGLKGVEIIEGFNEAMEYFYYRDGEKSFKRVVFFLGRVKGGEVKVSHEHIGYEWLNYAKAYERLTFQSAKELLDKAASR